MSGLLDLYLEKLTAKMNLDEEQRAKVEKELRSHLEEAVQRQVSSGRPLEDAEKEAIAAFGQPSLIARQFGIISGTGWLIFERCAYALFVMFPFSLNLALYHNSKNAIHQQESMNSGWLVLFVLVMVILGSFWSRIAVNGTLRIRRILRRTLSIPFEKIQKISFEKGHLFGKHGILVNYEGGKVVLGPNNRNFRCAAIALNVLAPEAMDDEVRNYIQTRATPVPCPESPLFRLLMSLFWLIPVSLLALSWSSLWALVQVHKIFFLAWVLVVSGLILQSYLHKNRAKKGLCWLLVSWILLMGFLNAFGIIFGERWTIHWLLSANVLLFLVPVLILWWPGTRLQLLAVCTVLFMTSWEMRWLYFPTGEGLARVYDLNGKFPDNLQYVGSDGKTIVLLAGTLVGDQETANPELIFLNETEPPLHRSLDPDMLWLFRQSQLAEYIDVQGVNNQEKENPCSQIKIFEKTGQVINEGELSASLSVRGDLGEGRSMVVSPGSDHVPVGLNKPGGYLSDNTMTGIFDLVTDTTVPLKISAHLVPVQWIDDHKLTALEYIHSATHSNTNPDHTHVRIWTVDSEIGSGTLERELPLPESSFPYSLAGGKYLCLYKGKFHPLNVNPQVGMALFDLNTGKETLLPERCGKESLPGGYLWSSSSHRLAYISGTKTDMQIVVADPTGVVATLPLENGSDITECAFSPDGTKLFLINWLKYDWYSNFFHRILWDINQNQYYTLRASGFMADGLEGAFAQRTAAWSPDSRFLAMSNTDSLNVVDIASWMEAQSPSDTKKE